MTRFDLNKDEIAAEVERRTLDAWHDLPSDRGPIGRYCILWAGITVDVLAEHGVRAVMQAGDAYWPVVDPEQDDGSMNTHYGYQYTSLGQSRSKR
jgi:hypothetical protein